MRQTTREFTVVSAWPKGITVGNWREEGCAAQSLIRSYFFISTTVDKAQLVVLRLVFSISGLKSLAWGNVSELTCFVSSGT